MRKGWGAISVRRDLFLLAIFAAPIAAQPTRADAEKDPVIAAMLQELDRSMSQLQLPGFQKPFFIQYRIVDVEDFETKAALAPARVRSTIIARIARVTVRVGDYKTDSSGGRGDGALELAALDDDPIALRSALWTATDEAYKNALAAYAQKQAALKQVQTPPQADDFSREKPVIALETPQTLILDSSAWEQRVARDSVGMFGQQPGHVDRIDRRSPRDFVPHDLDAEGLADLGPPPREDAALEHDRLAAARHGVDDGRFHSARPGGGDHHHVALGLQNVFESIEDLGHDRLEFRRAMMHDLARHRQPGRLGHLRRSGSQEVFFHNRLEARG